MHFGHPRLGPRRASTASACTTGCGNARPFGVMQRIFQAAAWLLAGIIVVLSLGPASVRPTTGAPHDLEHLLIFLATGMAFGFGYPDRFRLPTIIAQPTFAAAIEMAQIWAPGRHARMSDFLVDAAASRLGIGLSYAFGKAKSGDYPKVTARNRLAKHGAPFASPLVDRPPRVFGFGSIAAVFRPHRFQVRDAW